MFYCVYIGNSKVSSTAYDVHKGVRQASRVQKEPIFISYFTTVDYQKIIYE